MQMHAGPQPGEKGSIKALRSWRRVDLSRQWQQRKGMFEIPRSLIEVIVRVCKFVIQPLVLHP